jgi:hypothetical protein
MKTDFQKELNSVLLKELHGYENAQHLLNSLSVFSGFFVELIDFGGAELSGQSKLPPCVTPNGYQTAKKQIIQQLFINIYDRSIKSSNIDGQIYTTKLISRENVPVAVVIIMYSSEASSNDAASLLLQIESFCKYIYSGSTSPRLDRPSVYEAISHLLFDSDPDIASLVSALLPSYKNHFPIAPPYIALDFLSSTGDITALKTAYNHFDSFLPDSYRIMRKDSFQAIICNFDLFKSTVLREKCACLEEFCAKYSIHCGCSLAFSDIALRETYINQAKAVNHLGEFLDKSQCIYRADFLLPNQIAETVSFNNLGLSLVLSEILLLHNYDIENNSEYLHTLEVYLNKGRSITDTAASLFIDRSTLKYRLNKIRAMTNIDFSDDTKCVSLLMSCLIYNTHMRHMQKDASTSNNLN